VESGACTGYVSGAFNAIQIIGGVNFCLPVDMTSGQLANIFKIHLDNDPLELSFPGASIVMLALVKAFPCQREQ
jgi:hypothetical protein